jgi:hypothetical protein
MLVVPGAAGMASGCIGCEASAVGARVGSRAPASCAGMPAVPGLPTCVMPGGCAGVEVFVDASALASAVGAVITVAVGVLSSGVLASLQPKLASAQLATRPAMRRRRRGGELCIGAACPQRVPTRNAQVCVWAQLCAVRAPELRGS